MEDIEEEIEGVLKEVRPFITSGSAIELDPIKSILEIVTLEGNTLRVGLTIEGFQVFWA
jgi:hypothetical protein